MTLSTQQIVAFAIAFVVSNLTWWFNYYALKKVSITVIEDERERADAEKDRADTEKARANAEQNRADAAENKLAAVDVRDSHYPALQEANAFQVAMVSGVKAHLRTSEQAPFGRYTGRFNKFEDLCLFLMFDAPPGTRDLPDIPPARNVQ